MNENKIDECYYPVIYGTKSDCWVPITSVAPFYDQQFIKVDYQKCMSTYCPIIFDRDQLIKIDEFWMNHDPDK
jgi:hypothetical protein